MLLTYYTVFQLFLIQIYNYLGLPVRPLIFLKKQKISLEELYGYASSDEESTVAENDAEDSVPLGVEASAEETIEGGEGNFIKLSIIFDN